MSTLCGSRPARFQGGAATGHPAPGTILTPRLPGGDAEQQLDLLFGPAEFNPPLAAAIATPGPAAPSPQQPPTSPRPPTSLRPPTSPRPPTDDPIPRPDPHDGVDAAP